MKKPTQYTKLKKNSGFTLIEVLIATALLGFIGISITTYCVQAFDSWIFIRGSAYTTNTASAALNEMTTFIRQALDPTSNTAFEPEIGASSNKISFVCLDHTGTNERVMEYQKIDDRLYRIVDGVSSLLIYSGVKDISFVHTSSYVVTISSLTVESGNTEIALNRTIYLRNP